MSLRVITKLFCVLSDRGLIKIKGPDRKTFLQSLLTNDVQKLVEGAGLYAALLTPQGRFLHDMILVERGEEIFLDCEASRRDDLLKRLQSYKLRAKVEMEDVTNDYAVVVIFAPPFPIFSFAPDVTVIPDPRLKGLGLRIYVPQALLASVKTMLQEKRVTETGPVAYELHRLACGVPDGSRDMEPGKALPLENNLDTLNAISWDKGCYIGQEVTVRTKYKGVVRKRLFPVVCGEGVSPAPGTPVLCQGQEVGEMRSGYLDKALALLRVEVVESGEPLTAGEARISISLRSTEGK